jgi:hypothetical protein
MFRIKPQPGTLRYDVSLKASKEGDVWQPPTRKIYFTANVDDPAKIHLASGPILHLIGGNELTPVWVTIWDSPGSDKADGTSSFIHVSTDKVGGSEPHITISISLSPAQFEETLNDIRQGHEVSFSVAERGEYMFPRGGQPQIIGFEEPGWRAEGDSIKWRDDLQTAIAVGNVTINTKLGALSQPLDTDAEREEDASDAVDESTARWRELSALMQSLIDSIQSLEGTTVAAHRAIMGRVVWIIVLLAVAIAIAWFHR